MLAVFSDPLSLMGLRDKVCSPDSKTVSEVCYFDLLVCGCGAVSALSTELQAAGCNNHGVSRHCNSAASRQVSTAKTSLLRGRLCEKYLLYWRQLVASRLLRAVCTSPAVWAAADCGLSAAGLTVSTLQDSVLTQHSATLAHCR